MPISKPDWSPPRHHLWSSNKNWRRSGKRRALVPALNPFHFDIVSIMLINRMYSLLRDTMGSHLISSCSCESALKPSDDC
ncbi:hypothetical protein VFPPC_16824 [Pochonia chlamydosporia 170]|uniref:Uncharacterized protein n=1 Tax=Pochonia chlamydosporia 170 TaxID=1380566 RepID=A0A179F3L8_METCM|nr:hypothetical protein VFPPC_16824 [Pochonia chlamydosporia 170]OAQ60007.1 hypothetical protein VFPPC_16824 [Pochonia chlamydosporia 170]